MNKKVRLLFSRALLYPWLGKSVEREINIEHKCLGGNGHSKAYSTPGKQVSLSHLWMSKKAGVQMRSLCHATAVSAEQGSSPCLPLLSHVLSSISLYYLSTSR